MSDMLLAAINISISAKHTSPSISSCLHFLALATAAASQSFSSSVLDDPCDYEVLASSCSLSCETCAMLPLGIVSRRDYI